MQFIDSARLDLRDAQWNVRIRAFSDDGKLELTYKERYVIDGHNTVSALLATAAQDGFDVDPATYESQVEWGRDAKTLTLSTKTKSDQREPHPTDLPGERQSRETCIAAVPFRLDQEKTPSWVRGVLLHGHVYGPVHGRRWIGEFDNEELSMEAWNIRGEPGQADDCIVEVSVKENDPHLAEARFDSLFEFLSGKKWLQDKGGLKTGMILKRY